LKEELNYTKYIPLADLDGCYGPLKFLKISKKTSTRGDLDFDLGTIKRTQIQLWVFPLHVRIFCEFTHPVSQNQASSVKNVFRVASL
jgi:hypothetical protein